MENVNLFKHNSIKIINNNLNIYIDPFRIDVVSNDADIIFITHSHYDHFSIDDIMNIKKDTTKIVSTKDTYKEIKNYFKDEDIIIVEPNKSYNILGINFSTVRAYNVNKEYHPIENDWVGYILNIDEKKYYIMGDTDVNEDNSNIECDVLFIPIGGKFTMDYKEAADYTNSINPSVVIPTHYGLIVGDVDLGEKFKELINFNIECELYIK
mgnify:FL=1